MTSHLLVSFLPILFHNLCHILVLVRSCIPCWLLSELQLFSYLYCRCYSYPGIFDCLICSDMPDLSVFLCWILRQVLNYPVNHKSCTASFFIDWQFMLTIFIEAFFTLPLLMLFRIGVDAWMGLGFFSGLVKDDKIW